MPDTFPPTATPVSGAPSAAPSVADVAGHARRYTDYGVPDAGIRPLYATESVWQAWLDVEVALARAEGRLGIIPASAADTIAVAGRLDALDRDRITTGIRDQGHPLVPLIAELVRVAGADAGGYVHWGATSQNIMQTGKAVLLKRAHHLLADLIADCIDGLADLAERSADMLMAGRTHGQHAVPMTFGLKVATWLDEFVRAHERNEDLVQPCLTVMMGGAIGTFAALGDLGPKVQSIVADTLGLRPMDVPSRAILDPFAAYVGALAVTAASGARVCLDVATLMQTEFGEVSEPVPEGSVGSSTMPHKRNPKLTHDVLELAAEIRNLVPVAIGAMVHPHEADGSATATVADALERSVIALGDLLARLRIVITGLELFPDRMRQNLGLSGSLTSSEAVMLALGADIGRDRAHAILYDIAMRAARDGEDFLELLRVDPRVTRRLTGEQIRVLVDPAGHVGLSPNMARTAARRARDYLEQRPRSGPSTRAVSGVSCSSGLRWS